MNVQECQPCGSDYHLSDLECYMNDLEGHINDLEYHLSDLEGA